MLATSCCCDADTCSKRVSEVEGCFCEYSNTHSFSFQVLQYEALMIDTKNHTECTVDELPRTHDMRRGFIGRGRIKKDFSPLSIHNPYSLCSLATTSSGQHKVYRNSSRNISPPRLSLWIPQPPRTFTSFLVSSCRR